MATGFAYWDETERKDDDQFVADELGLPLEMLQPLLSGARARGIADAFDLLGMAAVLIDGHGCVLHVNAAARRMMGTDLMVASRHLVGADPVANRVIETMIARTVSGVEPVAPARVARAERTGLVLTAMRLPGAAQDAAQLLKAVIVLSEAKTSLARRKPLRSVMSPASMQGGADV